MEPQPLDCGMRGGEIGEERLQLEHDLRQQTGRAHAGRRRPGNVVRDNTVLANGRFGIDVQNTSEVWVEGNRVSYNRGFWGTTPGGTQPGLGLNLANLLKSTVFDNRARNNTGMDLNWDGKSDNRVEANACEISVPAGACGR